MKYWAISAWVLLHSVAIAQRPPGKRKPPISRRPIPHERTVKPVSRPAVLRSEGLVRQINGDTVIVEANDTRILTLKLSKSTEMDPAVQKGAAVHIEASSDMDGNLLATLVRSVEVASIHPAFKGAEPEIADARTSSDGAEELLARARLWSATLIDKLPGFACKQLTTRYVFESKEAGWRATSLVLADLIYLNGSEDYQNISIDGHKTRRAMPGIAGTKSTGEYATALRDLFAPETRAEFRYSRPSNLNGVAAETYDFRVARAASDWKIFVGGQAIVPAFSGRVWLHARTAHVLRIEMEAGDVPAAFPLDRVESAIEYGIVRLGSGEYFLPLQAENLACHRDSPLCDRNVVEFRNYRVFTAGSKISFGPE